MIFPLTYLPTSKGGFQFLSRPVGMESKILQRGFLFANVAPASRPAKRRDAQHCASNGVDLGVRRRLNLDVCPGRQPCRTTSTPPSFRTSASASSRPQFSASFNQNDVSASTSAWQRFSAKVSAFLETYPLVRRAGLISAVCSAALFFSGIFLRNVDSLSGFRMGCVALAPVGLQLWSDMGGLLQEGRSQVLLGLVLKACAVGALLVPFTFFLEEYFYEFTWGTFGLAVGLASINFFAQRIIYSKFLQQSEGDQSAADYLKGVDLENLQSRVAIRLSFLTAFFSTAVFFPFLEEILYRGIVATSLARVNTNLGIGASALAFAVMSPGNLIERGSNLVLGAMLAAAYLLSGGNVLLPILTHTLLRAASFAVDYEEVLGLAFKVPKKGKRGRKS
ncbi:hypothetical protein BSKO_09011 [Bryopsis sp. KO-2023]|nr:hypothetical protein BSKO_09011 [Bryopsis sp. KO-2023]